MKKTFLLASVFFLAACADNHSTTMTVTPETKPIYSKDPNHETHYTQFPPASAYYNRGDPENLLDVSSELVTLPLGSRSDMIDLSDMVMQDPPTLAELRCAPTESLCMQAKELFEQYGVPAKFASGSKEVALMYERVMARDCENRYLDNSSNVYNLHPPTFGCSVMANTVQMVSDKRQFVRPSLLDYYDGEKAVRDYDHYLNPVESDENDDPVLDGMAISGGQ